MSSSFASRRAFSFLTVASTLLFAATTSGQTLDSHLCGQFQAAPNSDGQYIFNNNAWGDDGSGAECTDVFDDGASFQTIWSWAKNGNDTHSFPNVQLNSQELFPLLMTDLAAMNLQATWTMSPVDGATRANIVYDMFVDPSKSIAVGNTSTTASKYEIMIWIGAYGDPFPLGASVNPFTGVLNVSQPSVDLAGTTFSLFSGENTGGQTVHSWLALTNQGDFSADVTPLITYLTTNNLVESDAYLGILQFGSETWHSTANVTFDVKSFNLNVTSTNAKVNAAASAAIHPSSTSGSSTSAPSSTSQSSSTPNSSSASNSTESSSSPSSTGTPSSVSSTSSSGSSATGSSSSGSGSSTTSSSPSSGSSSPSSSSSTISLPFWFWEIAGAGCLFAML